MRARLTTAGEVFGAVLIVASLAPWPHAAAVVGGCFIIAVSALEGRKQ